MPPDTIRTLVLEDNPGDVRLLRELLSEAAPSVFDQTVVETVRDALARLREGRFDLILSDLSLPDSRGIETFLQLQEQAKRIPIVVLTGTFDESLGVEAVAQGAQDYFVKGQVDGKMLVRSLRYAIERKRLQDREIERRSQTGYLWQSLFRTLGRGAAAVLYQAGLQAAGNSIAVIEATKASRGVQDLTRTLRDHFGTVGLFQLEDLQVDTNASRVVARVTGSFEATISHEKSPEATCHFVRGLLCGISSRLVADSNLVCDETRCEAEGHEACEFLVHPMFG